MSAYIQDIDGAFELIREGSANPALGESFDKVRSMHFAAVNYGNFLLSLDPAVEDAGKRIYGEFDFSISASRDCDDVVLQSGPRIASSNEFAFATLKLVRKPKRVFKDAKGGILDKFLDGTFSVEADGLTSLPENDPLLVLNTGQITTEFNEQTIGRNRAKRLEHANILQRFGSGLIAISTRKLV